ncbi:MAG: hypothetical protein KC457_08820 [Myxococcales bacterium]|nr:hypothetical protein [Myxococcales bacterium]
MPQPQDRAENKVALADLRRRAQALAIERYTEGLIDAEELEGRIEAILDAEASTAIVTAITDLLEPGTSTEEFLAPTVERALVGTTPQEQRVFAAFNTARREGRWIPARKTKVVAVFGEVILDYSRALLSIGITAIDLQVSACSTRVIVPPDVAVRVDTSVILGSIDIDPSIRQEPVVGEPILVFGGHVVLGTLRVHQVKQLVERTHAKAIRG